MGGGRRGETCERKKNEKTRNEYSSLRRCLTRRLRPTEAQVFHAHGKMPLRKVTCERQRDERQEKGRKEERRG